MRRYSQYGAFVANSSPGLSHLTWDVPGERMYYKGTLITFEHQRQMRLQNQEEAVALYKKLLCGLDVYFKHGVPEDDPSIEEPGYSFKTNAANRNMFRVKHLFMTALLKNARVREKFVHISKDGTATWLPGPILLWLRDYAEFHKKLLIAAELNTAGPARGSELTCMQIVNTRTAPRNIYFLGRHLVLRRRYHKNMARMRGMELALPEPLDACISHLVLQEMCVIRDFAIFCAIRLYGKDAKIIETYKTSLFVNVTRRFTTDDLSEGLKALSMNVIGREFGVRDQRHQQIGFMRYQEPEMVALQRPDESEEEIEDVEAEQAGHSHSTHMRYAISSNGWRGMQEDRTPKYIKRAMEWQRKLHLVPGTAFSYDATTLH